MNEATTDDIHCPIDGYMPFDVGTNSYQTHCFAFGTFGACREIRLPTTAAGTF